MLHRPYLRSAALGIVVTGTLLAALYAALVLSGNTSFSSSAFAGVVGFSIPGGAILGLMLAADSDPRDD